MWYTHRPIAKARFPGRNSEGLRVDKRQEDVGMVNERENV